MLPEHDALAVHDWLAVAMTDGSSGDQKIFLAAPLSLKEIEDSFANQIETRDGVFLGFTRGGRHSLEVTPPRCAGAGGKTHRQG